MNLRALQGVVGCRRGRLMQTLMMCPSNAEDAPLRHTLTFDAIDLCRRFVYHIVWFWL